MERELAEARSLPTCNGKCFEDFGPADPGCALHGARSHGKVLATRTTTIGAFDPKRRPGKSYVMTGWLDCEPGTEVLVVRATADQEKTDGE